ncbi:MAG TPA: glycosyltransferase family 9 protein [Anaerohalosphaeraceae bacterium]|nr:glycosyltransferase family 9 protein [Anaerohalosphaeraceae bacterium]
MEAIFGKQTYRKGLILHPGAIGDCLLALPTASLMKQRLGIEQVDWIGRTEYIEFYPGRSAVDRIRSLDSIPLHRLFQKTESFEVQEHDPLVYSFAGYEQVVSFLGHENPDFEQNLLFTVHCSQSAQVLVLPPDKESYKGPIGRFYLEEIAAENQISLDNWQTPSPLLEPHPTDFSAGREQIQQLGINPDRSIVLIHPGSGGQTKCWAAENFILLAQMLRQERYEVIFLLGPAERERFSVRTLRTFHQYPYFSELSLTQILQVLACSDGYVGNDSGITHLAAALAKPTLAVFGPTDPAKFAPVGPKVRILRLERTLFKQFSEPCVHQALTLLREIL